MTTTETPPASTAPPTPVPARPTAKPTARRWAPRFLQGTDAITWAKVLWRNRFAVHPKYWYIAGIVSATSTMNLVLRWMQHGLTRPPRATQIDKHPVFVIGHWRTGTTLLHELLIQDAIQLPGLLRLLQSESPAHFERFFKTYLKFLAPEQRPMDNMAAGWDRPGGRVRAALSASRARTSTSHSQPRVDVPCALDLSGSRPRNWRSGSALSCTSSAP